MDFQSLRRHGLDLLEQWNGGRWTDFNSHDPGITLLEAMCYALSDWSYRIAHPVPDLLASGGRDPYRDLPLAPQILSCGAVTANDLRAVVLDQPGVAECWVEAMPEADVPLHFHPERQELRAEPKPPGSEPVILGGLLRVGIQLEDVTGLDGREVLAHVTATVHAHRGLCQDVAEIRILERQEVRLDAALEIGPVEQAEDILLEIWRQVSNHLTPPVRFASRLEARVQGHGPEALFEGPMLRRGVLQDASDSLPPRRSALYASDLIRRFMDVPGVRAVPSLSLIAAGKEERWVLPLDAERVPSFDPARSSIRLLHGGQELDLDLGRLQRLWTEERTRAVRRPAPEEAATAPWPLPPGRDRRVADYPPLGQELPSIYGVGALGLAPGASPQRRAQASQLRAYLAFFDHLLADGYAQLAHLPDLLSVSEEDDGARFPHRLSAESLGLDSTVLPDAQAWQGVHDAARDLDAEHRHKVRILDHLLARFGEAPAAFAAAYRFDDKDSEEDVDGGGGSWRQASALEAVLRSKRRFLRRIVDLGQRRGQGCNLLAPSDTADVDGRQGGLELRLRLLLDLDVEVGEDLLVIEHLLLRPMSADLQQRLPLLSTDGRKDPYSWQLSVVLPTSSGRCRSSSFRTFVETTVRREVPAHIVPYVRWLDEAAWLDLKTHWQRWLGERRSWLLGRST